MKIVITGSLGNISLPLTQSLIQKGHQVSVISSTSERKKDIEALGASAAIGSVEDAAFLTGAFEGTDIVYCMVPPSYWHTGAEPIGFYKQVGSSYAEAIRKAGARRVINLSSFGADLEKGTGFIVGAYHVENILNELTDAHITHMRPASFYNNLFSFVDVIKQAGVIVSNYGGDDKLVLVSPKDIASAIVSEIETPASHRKISYVASEELTGHEVAAILGAAIGRPDLKWIVTTDQEVQNALEAGGMPKTIVSNLVELNASMHSGELSKDYFRHRPKELGPTKLKDFAKEFAKAFAEK